MRFVELKKAEALEKYRAKMLSVVAPAMRPFLFPQLGFILLAFVKSLQTKERNYFSAVLGSSAEALSLCFVRLIRRSSPFRKGCF
jgi:hypothetical protein